MDCWPCVVTYDVRYVYRPNICEGGWGSMTFRELRKTDDNGDPGELVSRTLIQAVIKTQKRLKPLDDITENIGAWNYSLDSRRGPLAWEEVEQD